MTSNRLFLDYKARRERADVLLETLVGSPEQSEQTFWSCLPGEPRAAVPLLTLVESPEQSEQTFWSCLSGEPREERASLASRVEP